MKSNCGTDLARASADGGGMASNAANPGPRMGCAGGWYAGGYAVDVVVVVVDDVTNGSKADVEGGVATAKSPSCDSKSIGVAAAVTGIGAGAGMACVPWPLATTLDSAACVSVNFCRSCDCADGSVAADVKSSIADEFANTSTNHAPCAPRVRLAYSTTHAAR